MSNFPDERNQRTVFIYAGVEGAGKTSISGILNDFCDDYLETTLTEEKDLQYIRNARNQGAYVHMFYAGLNSLEEHLERIENRVRKGGEDAHPDIVKRQFESRWKALERALPLCNEVSFYDFTNGIILVASYRHEIFSVTEKGQSCDWLLEWYRHYSAGMHKNVET